MKFNRVERYRLWRTMIRKFPELKTIKEKVSLAKFTTQQLVAFLKLCRKLSLLRKYMKKKEKATSRKMRVKGRGKMTKPRRQTRKKRAAKPSRSLRSKPSKGPQSKSKKKSKSSGKSKQSKNSKQSKQSK